MPLSNNNSASLHFANDAVGALAALALNAVVHGNVEQAVHFTTLIRGRLIREQENLIAQLEHQRDAIIAAQANREAIARANHDQRIEDVQRQFSADQLRLNNQFEVEIFILRTALNETMARANM